MRATESEVRRWQELHGLVLLATGALRAATEAGDVREEFDQLIYRAWLQAQLRDLYRPGNGRKGDDAQFQVWSMFLWRDLTEARLILRQIQE